MASLSSYGGCLDPRISPYCSPVDSCSSEVKRIGWERYDGGWSLDWRFHVPIPDVCL
eukprot:c55826_g1_i1 orf=101-271(+)